VKVGSNVSDARKMEEVAPAKHGYDIYHCVITYNTNTDLLAAFITSNLN
jgi:hypothetical protein